MTSPIAVLILDDDEASRVTLSCHLETAAAYLKMEIVIHEAESAHKAWRIWKENRIHGIITDMVLGGGVSGLQFLVEARKDAPKGYIPAIILTGVMDEYNQDRMWTHAQVVHKPMMSYFYKKLVFWLGGLENFWKAAELDTKEK